MTYNIEHVKELTSRVQEICKPRSKGSAKVDKVLKRTFTKAGARKLWSMCWHPPALLSGEVEWRPRETVAHPADG